MLLFVHPDKIVEPVSIEEVAQIEAQIGGVGDHSGPEPQVGPTAKPTPWSHDFVPTGVQLVELLQFVLSPQDVYPLARIAIIVSAWDNYGLEQDQAMDGFERTAGFRFPKRH
jgi:hypothetical protein